MSELELKHLEIMHEISTGTEAKQALVVPRLAPGQAAAWLGCAA